MKKIAIQGGRGSFHDIAAHEFFGDDIEIIACELPFKNVFESLKKETSFALCAIENSLYGSINEVYDLLLSSDFPIIGEVYLPIHQQLIGFNGTELNNIKEVHSHPIALAQCELFLDTHLPQASRHEHDDTALSVRDIKARGNKSHVAIASREAATLHGMGILKENIETNHENYTRFVVLGKLPAVHNKNSKSSLVLQTKADTKPGALHGALGIFAKHNLNLTLLHSRPIIGKAWNYMFYIDVIGGKNDTSLLTAQAELHELGWHVTNLGSYIPGQIK